MSQNWQLFQNFCLFQFPILEMGFLNILQEFAGGTSIHGFTFLVRPTSSIRTKIIWALCLVVAITYASVQMRLSVVGKYHFHYLLEIKKYQPMIILKQIWVNSAGITLQIYFGFSKQVIQFQAVAKGFQKYLGQLLTHFCVWKWKWNW